MKVTQAFTVFQRRLFQSAAVCLAIFLVGGQAASSSAMQPDERDLSPLERWLAKHELHDLTIELLERELARESVGGRRLPIARKLAGKYTARLSQNRFGFDETLAALDSLAVEFPEVVDRGARLEIAFGYYRRARALFDDWIWKGDSGLSRSDVHRHFKALAARVELERTVIDTSPAKPAPTDDGTAAEKGLFLAEGDSPDGAPHVAPPPRQTETRTETQLQADYLLAWALYFQATTSDDETDQRKGLKRAEQAFRGLLLVPNQTKLNELRPEWFSLESRWFCQVLAGAAMVHQALGNEQEADYCFRLLGDPRVPPDIRRLHRVWRFQSMVFASQINEAAAMAANTADEDHAANVDLELWYTVALAGLGRRRTTGEDSGYDALAVTGLAALATEGQWETIDRLLDANDRAIAGTGFFPAWLEGYRQLHIVRNGMRQEGTSLGNAIELLDEALDTAERVVPGLTSDVQFQLRARCRYHLGFSLWLDGRYEAAIEQFRQAAPVLRQTDRESAEHALWMVCLATERLASGDSVWLASLAEAIDEFERRYPQSPKRRDVAFLRMIVNTGRQQPEAALQSLRLIPPEDAGYLLAQRERCRVAHEQWSAATPDDSRRAELAREVVDSAKRVIENAGQSDGNSEIGRTCLFAADVLIHGDPPNPLAADGWLALHQEHSAGDGRADDVAGESQFLNLLVGQAFGDAQRAENAARWLTVHAARPEHRRAGWMELAGILERKIHKEDQAGRAAGRELLIEAADYLQNAVDSAPLGEGVSTDRTGLSALSRLADLQSRLERHEVAYVSYHRLTSADPERVAWQRGLARSAMKLDQWDEAAGLWRSIAASRSAGDNEWLEAKYYLAESLARSELREAARVVEQVRLLAPQMPKAWSERFEELDARIKGQTP